MRVRAKKHLGQHFLKDLDAARRIAEGITKHQGCTDVLEVGPGTGALTRPLLDRGDLDVRAVELDDESVLYLTTQGVLGEDKVFGGPFEMGPRRGLSQWRAIHCGRQLSLQHQLPNLVSCPGLEGARARVRRHVPKRSRRTRG